MKIQRSITVDVDLWLELQARKVNVSGLCNDYLRSYLRKEKKSPANLGKDLELELNSTRAKLLDLERAKGKVDKVKKDKEKVVIHF